MLDYSWERLSIAYIFRILSEGKFVRGVDSQLHDGAKTIHNFVQQHLQQYQAMPSHNHLKETYNIHFDNYAMPELTTKELCDRIREHRIKSDVMVAAGELQKFLSVDGMTSKDLIKPLLKLNEQIFNIPDTQIHCLSDVNSILQYYRERGGSQICEYGIPSLDKHTGGITEGDFIVIYANTSQGKSTMSRHFAGNMAYQGKRVLYFTLEESGRKSVLKAVATQLKVPYNPLIETTYDQETYNKLVEFENNKPKGNIFFVDRLETGSITEIAKYVHETQPDVIFMDQIPHLVRDKHTSIWEATTHIVSQLRQYSQNSRIPMIALTQANRAGMKKNATLEESMSAAYAQAQDASVVIFIHPDEDGAGYIRKRISLLKNRDHQRGQHIDLKWQIDKGIIEEETMSLEFYGTGGSENGTNLPTNQHQPVAKPESLQPNTITQSLPPVDNQTVGSGKPCSGWL